MALLKSYAVRTHQGPYLRANEDRETVDLAHQLYLLADGIGGSGIGDYFAALATDNIQKFYTRLSADPDATRPFFYSERFLIEGNALINAFYYTHDLITQENARRALAQRGACSVVGLAGSEHYLSLVGIGNVVVYLWRQQKIHPLLLPETAWPAAVGGMVLPSNALGLYAELQIWPQEIQLQEGDLILAASDGVYGLLLPDEIAAILRSEYSLGKKIDWLFSLANDRGNKDNQSTIMLQY